MGTKLTNKQTIVALAVGMVGILVVFYVPMILWSGEHSLLDWLLPGIFIVIIFYALPLGVVLANSLGLIVMLPFHAIVWIVDRIKKKI